MKTHRLLLIVLLTTVFSMQAQKKKELLSEIKKYSTQIKKLKVALASTEQRERLAEKKIATLTEQNLATEQEKQELLKTISGFTSVSKQKAANLSTSLQTIKEKDRQLKIINDALAATENNKLKQLTTVRDSLGTLGKIGFKNGLLRIEINNNDLYNNEDLNTKLTETGKQAIEKLGDFLKYYTEYKITIEGNSNALNFDDSKKMIQDNWDFSALQVSSIARILHNNCSINPNRIKVVSNGEYQTQGINTTTNIIIQPRFKAFYELVKETMKQ